MTFVSVAFTTSSPVAGLLCAQQTRRFHLNWLQSSRTCVVPAFARRRVFSDAPVLSAKTTRESVPVKTPLSTFARGATFSRRIIGLYELKRAGVDASVLLKRDLKFERTFLLIVAAFTSILFFIPVLTDTSYPEGPLAALVAVIMGIWAIDTLGFNAALTQTLVAAFNDRVRVARHEAAHLLVAHLLGFRVSDVALPLPRSTWRAVRNEGPAVGVTLSRSFAEDDPHRVAAAGLAGLAAELLCHGDAKGAESDMAVVSRRIRRLVNTSDRSPHAVDEEVKHTVRWGLLVAARLISTHHTAFDAIVDALLQGRDAQTCVRLIDELASPDGLVQEPYGSS